MGAESRVLVIGCGAMAREILRAKSVNGLDWIDVECLPASLHNTPREIPSAVEGRLKRAGGYRRVLVAYADCGTGGLLDRVLEEYGAERLEGAHCYDIFGGAETLAAIQDADPGTFYLTDYLARHFDRLVWQGLGLDRFPELAADYFGNYTRLVYLAQTPDPGLDRRARDAARALGLRYSRLDTGLGGLEPALVRVAGAA